MDSLIEAFGSVISVFQFIFSLLQTIIEGVWGIYKIILNIPKTIDSILHIMPIQLYAPFSTFLTLYFIIMIFKLFRKG